MSVGAQLRQARTERALSVQAVTQATKIQPWVIEALEADQLPERLSAIYVKGFLASYARFLHLDAESLTRQMHWPEEPSARTSLPPAPITEAPLAASHSTPPVAASSPSASTATAPSAASSDQIALPAIPRWLVVGLSLGLACAVLVVVHPWRPRSTASLNGAPRPTKVAHSDTRHPAGRLARASDRHAPKVSAQASGQQNRQVAQAITPSEPAAVAFTRTTSHSDIAHAPRQVGVVKEQPSIVLASVVPITETIRSVELPPIIIPSSKPLDVVADVARATWVQVRADGKLMTQQRLSQGSNERWRAKKQCEIVIANPAHVALTLNGQPITSFAIAYQGRLLITHRGITKLPDE